MPNNKKVEKCKDEKRKLNGFKFGDSEFYGRFAFQRAKKAEAEANAEKWRKKPRPLPVRIPDKPKNK